MPQVSVRFAERILGTVLGAVVRPHPLTAVVERRTQRLALFSHDTQGLGHVRRNALVAASIVADQPRTDVLLLTGAPEAMALPMPPHTEVVTIPTLRKARTGSYGPRVLSTSLQEVLAMREAVVDAALMSFAPDLLIVDKAARGVGGELDRPLAHVRDRHGTATVLGLRDVLDGRAATSEEWALNRTDEVVDDLYDQLWVYGDPAVFDTAREYGWPASTTRKIRYTGYLSRGRSSLLRADPRVALPCVNDVATPFVLGLVGGGQDGDAVALAFARATYPAGHTGVLITGPYTNRRTTAELDTLAQQRTDLRVLRLVPDVPGFIDRAAAAVSMGGYNTVCELLAGGLPALLVPRTVPRTEQALRADRLGDVGLVDVLAADELTPGRVGEWLSAAVTRPRTHDPLVDLDGLDRVPRLAEHLIRDGIGVSRPENGHVAV